MRLSNRSESMIWIRCYLVPRIEEPNPIIYETFVHIEKDYDKEKILDDIDVWAKTLISDLDGWVRGFEEVYSPPRAWIEDTIKRYETELEYFQIELNVLKGLILPHDIDEVCYRINEEGRMEARTGQVLTDAHKEEESR